MHDVGALAARRRAWRVLRATYRSQSADNVESRGPVDVEAGLSWGLSERESRGYRSPEAGTRGSEGAVGLARRFRGYRDPDVTFPEQGLGSTAWHGFPSWAQRRVQRPVTPAPSCLE